jgi:hypothetical protein
MTQRKESYRNVRKEKYTQISNSLLNDKEATLQAKGLLSIFLSNTKDWEIHMKEIISRSKNGRDAHYKVINELIELGYFARIQVVGKHFEEMIYLFSDEKEDVANEIENLKKWAEENGKTLLIEYKTVKKRKREKAGDSNENPFPENQDTETTNTENKDNNNTKNNNTKNKVNNNIYKDYIDDDKRTSSNEEISPISHNDDMINLIISNFREATKDDLSERSFKAVVRKVIDKYNQGKVNSFRDYLATALANKIYDLELRRAKDKARENLKTAKEQLIQEKIQKLEQLEKKPYVRRVPLYNWLEE